MSVHISSRNPGNFDAEIILSYSDETDLGQCKCEKKKNFDKFSVTNNGSQTF